MDQLVFTLFNNIDNMKVIALVLAVIAVAAAAPPLVHFGDQSSYTVQNYQTKNNDASKTAKILRFEQVPSVASDGYKYAVETSDGIVKEEIGEFENAGTKDQSLRVVGRFLYPGGPNGELLELTYVADKNGFQPQGAHLPQVQTA